MPITSHADIKRLSNQDQAALTRFYPCWWIYPTKGWEYEGQKPFYIVKCYGPEETALAQRLQPDWVRAEITDRLAVPGLPYATEPFEPEMV